ncbi:hypothetical protein CNBE3470 [Cryptococcus deneoformans B-3501A]|uniref:DNL-type domain-containing protein n=1 Tax=Cryptococcus deneoformans (strain JEC21 / ATCC MYA-565) TaxID=214684 RepID=A0A0S2LIQ5_CRYD1|nr:hypothetical protein CNE03465 [Cryptococcus neoformans var. neoformans JEC21]XP_775073.1 hypothetical protein CNBE3470 [Cryptococcus neoformans var. neoformans B-3501A]ALO60577.1 hypothetical protein CNE03465 [Cryptococcus neoformans var. neoformans JEC21]EAL20426.1 hypothetical protein CNBE3470 [Cryptococcus neoformans var. neoformans B-3501A]
MSAIRTSILRSFRATPTTSRAIVVSQKFTAFRQSLHLHPAYQTARRWNSSVPENPQLEAPENGSSPRQVGQIEPRLQMTFTCTADDCGHRSTHEFSKRSYQKGIVLVQCPSCKARHLIADHLGWFKESLEGGKLKTVEDLLAAKGEKIKKGRINFDGDIEIEDE